MSEHNRFIKIHPGKHHSTYSAPFLKEKEKAIYTNRNIIPFANLTIGSQDVVFDIPWSGALLRGVMVSFTVSSGTVVDAWGYKLIRQLRWQVGSASIQQKSGEQMFLEVLNDCETSEKRAQVLSLSGTAGAIASSTTVYVWIPLPWSKIRSSHLKPSFDANTVGSNIKLYISTYPATSAFTAGPPATFDAAQLIYRSGMFLNKSSYLKLVNSGAFYTYPFSFHQSVYKQYTSSNQGNQIALDAWRNGSVKAVYIQDYTTTAYDTNKDLTDTSSISNIRLEFNGSTILRSDDEAERLLQLSEIDTANFIKPNKPYYVLLLSQVSPKMLESLGSNSGRNFAGQTLQLYFTPSDDSVLHKLFITYVYNAQVVCDGKNSQIFL